MGAEEAPDADAAFWSALGERGTAMRDKYGSPAAFVESYNAAQSRIGSLGDEVGQLRRHVQESEQARQALEDSPANQGPERITDPAALDFSALAMQSGFDEETALAIGGLFQVHSNILTESVLNRVRTEVGEGFKAYDAARVAPVIGEHEINQVAEELEAIESTYGEHTFDRLDPIVEGMRDYAQENGMPDPTTTMSLRALYAEAAAVLQAEDREEEALRSGAYMLDPGGRRVPVPTKDAGEAELDLMESTIKRHRLV